MSKLTKAQAKAHKAACEVLKKDKLSIEDRWFVIENWQESANHVNSTAGAFFTPAGLAGDFAIDVCGHRIIDLCAGIGTLSFAHHARCLFADGLPDITCVELNPAYVEVGKKVLPEAKWIEASIFDVDSLGLGKFDYAISNPPFGSTAREGQKAPRFTGTDFEYHVIDIASDLADYGTFIIPQMSAPFTFSGRQHFEEKKHDKYLAFVKQTGIELTNGCGVDTAYHQDEWRGVSPRVEIVLADFMEARARREAPPVEEPKPADELAGQIDMFQEAAE